MSTALSQEKLEELVVGKVANPSAIFFEQAVLNVQKSNENDRRMYETKTYIKLSQPGVSDSVSYEAQREDLQKYPDEYAYFLQNKQGVRSPGVEIIPNLDIAHLQELRDYGILTIPKLAEMEIVPPHLEYAHRAALIFNAALKETSNGSIEEDLYEEGSVEETVNNQIKAGTQVVSETDRSEHGNDVGQCKVPASIEKSTIRRDSKRVDKVGLKHNIHSVGSSIDNWSIELTP